MDSHKQPILYNGRISLNLVLLFESFSITIPILSSHIYLRSGNHAIHRFLPNYDSLFMDEAVGEWLVLHRNTEELSSAFRVWAFWFAFAGAQENLMKCRFAHLKYLFFAISLRHARVQK
jgi:hypothetical protein